MKNVILFFSLFFISIYAFADSSTYIKGPQLSESNQSIVSSSGTTQLTSLSPMKTVITGTLGHIVKLPDSSVLPVGYSYHIINKSSASITINDFGGTTLDTITTNTDKVYILFSGGVWNSASGGSAGKTLVGSSPIVVTQDATSATLTFSIPSCGTGQHIAYNGTGYTCVDPTVSAGQASNYFFIDTLSGISTYLTLSRTASTSVEEVDSIPLTVNNTETAYGGYADGAIGSTSIEAGVWEFNLYRAVTVGGAGGTTEIRIHVFKRTTGGTETELFQLTTGDINDTAITLQTIRTTQPSFSVNADDILLVKIYGITTAQPKTVSFTHNGNARNSFLVTPITVRHNQLVGLQGGTSNEYYHMTANQNLALWTATGTDVYRPSGKVGIGTATPSAILGIQGTTQQLRLGYDSSNYSSISTTNIGRMSFLSTSDLFQYGGTSPTIKLTSADYTTQYALFQGSAAGTSLYNYVGSFGIRNVANSNLTFYTNNVQKINISPDTNGQIDFYNGSGKVIFNGTGNVGIGTTTPTSLLHVYGSSVAANSGGMLRIQSSDVATVDKGASLAFSGNSYTSNTIFGEISARSEGGAGNDRSYLTLATNGVGGLLERVRINSNGNVGIGTAAPATALHVTGDITQTGYHYFGLPSVDGSFRMYVSGGALITEKRLSGVWTEVSRVDEN